MWKTQLAQTFGVKLLKIQCAWPAAAVSNWPLLPGFAVYWMLKLSSQFAYPVYQAQSPFVKTAGLFQSIAFWPVASLSLSCRIHIPQAPPLCNRNSTPAPVRAFSPTPLAFRLLLIGRRSVDVAAEREPAAYTSGLHGSFKEPLLWKIWFCAKNDAFYERLPM